MIVCCQTLVIETLAASFVKPAPAISHQSPALEEERLEVGEGLLPQLFDSHHFAVTVILSELALIRCAQ